MTFMISVILRNPDASGNKICDINFQYFYLSSFFFYWYVLLLLPTSDSTKMGGSKSLSCVFFSSFFCLVTEYVCNHGAMDNHGVESLWRNSIRMDADFVQVWINNGLAYNWSDVHTNRNIEMFCCLEFV